MAGFSGLNSAVSGLRTQSSALDVISHNIANVNTPGFSRRTVQLAPAGIGAVASLYSRNLNHGNGVTIDSITRVRDEFLETKFLGDMGRLGFANRNAEALMRVEQTFPEPSDTGMAAQLQQFWGSWDAAANQPDSLPARSMVLQRAGTLVSSFKNADANLNTDRRNSITYLSSTATEVNDAAARVADLNGQIRSAQSTGHTTYDLADERDQLIERIANLTGATTKAGEHGQVNVYLGGGSLVFGNSSQRITTTDTGTLDPPLNATGLPKIEVTWELDGTAVASLSGEMGGLKNGINDTFPTYINELNEIAASVVSAVNTLHLTGQGLDSVNDVSLNFFDPTGVTAATIAVSADVAGQPSRIALAALGGGELDASIGQSIADLIDSPGGPDAVFRDMLGDLAGKTSTALGRVDLQQKVAVDSDSLRKSVSGVNLDEEMTNLIATQRAYEAAARLLTTIDQMLDTLINRTGVVGR